jgi:flavin-binding protein dodecin
MSVYRVTEIIGTSRDSWEDAAREALAAAAGSLRDLRVAEVVEQDIALAADGSLEAFRTKLRVSFKYEQAAGQSQRTGEGARQPQPAQ